MVHRDIKCNVFDMRWASFLYDKYTTRGLDYDNCLPFCFHSCGSVLFAHQTEKSFERALHYYICDYDMLFFHIGIRVITEFHAWRLRPHKEGIV